MAHADLGDAQAELLLEKLAAFDPIEADAIRAFLLWKQGKQEEATVVVARTLAALRQDPWPVNVRHLFPLSIQLAQGDQRRARRLFNALDQPLAAYIYEDSRRSTATRVADELGPEVSAGCIKSYEPNVIWSRAFLDQRYRAYEQTHDPDTEKARRDLEAFQRNAPDATIPPASPATDAK